MPIGKESNGEAYEFLESQPQLLDEALHSRLALPIAGQIVLFSITGCAHCREAKALLDTHAPLYPVHVVGLDGNSSIKEWLVGKTGRRMVPQMFFNDEYIPSKDALIQIVGTPRFQELLDLVKVTPATTDAPPLDQWGVSISYSTSPSTPRHVVPHGTSSDPTTTSSTTTTTSPSSSSSDSTTTTTTTMVAAPTPSNSLDLALGLDTDSDPLGFECEKDQFAELVLEMRDPNTGVQVRDRIKGWSLHKRCFVGSRAVSWLMERRNISAYVPIERTAQEIECYGSLAHWLVGWLVGDSAEAVALGNELQQRHFFHHVKNEHDFKNDAELYRFLADESSTPLNMLVLSDCSPRPAVEVADELRY
jgi:glutaredoxin